MGKLIRYCFKDDQTTVNCVNDRNHLINEQNNDFDIEYFFEALKCGRYKYAYEKLSYELRADISMDVLKQYFKQFDNYKYIDNINTYVTFKNYKVTGVYRFELNQKLIDNIY